MAVKDIIIMSREELKRIHILGQALDKKISQVKAAKVLGLSDRQVRRVVKRIKEHGQESIAHRARGKPSNRRLSDGLKSKVLKLYDGRYYDFGPTLANEKLFEKHKIKIGTQTLRNWLIESGKWQARTKRRKHLHWRERKACFGELVQMDGSHHHWFEDRGPKCVLMGYVDDATSRVYARFYEYEGTIPAMDSLRRYIKKYGIPHSLYLDKHTTYKSTGKQTIEQEMRGIKPMSEFERAVKELSTELIHANSPQAKGRVERSFKTFQDRVVKEMRLLGIKNIAEGNAFLEEYLPEYNRRFSKEPAQKGDMHRPAGRKSLDSILCFKKERVLRNDYTVAHEGRLYQVLQRTIAKRVIVETRLNGSVHITYNGKKLRYRPIQKRPAKVKSKPVARPKKVCTDPQERPWTKPIYSAFTAAKRARKEALENIDELILTNT